MLNRIDLMGRLTRDVELRRTGSGVACANFAIACDRDFAPKDGGERETDFFDIVAWRGTAEFADKYFHKGDMIVISGRLQARSWTDKDGNKRRTVEVVADNIYFGGAKKTENTAFAAPTGSFEAMPTASFEAMEGEDEQLPF